MRRSSWRAASMASVIALLWNITPAQAQTSLWIDPFVPKRPNGFHVGFWTGTVRGFEIEEVHGFQNAHLLFRRSGEAADRTIYLGFPFFVNGAPYKCHVPSTVGWLQLTYGVCAALPDTIALGKTLVRLDVWEDTTPEPGAHTEWATDALTVISP